MKTNIKRVNKIMKIGKMNISKRKDIRNFGLIGIAILFAILIATPALSAPGKFTGCLSISKGTLYNIRSGSSPISSCSNSDIIISFYDSNTVDTLKKQVATLQVKVTTLQQTLKGVTRKGNDIHITGANLHIESGSGRTDGPINGLGNLIIGYNEPRGGDIRTGSHNLILGSQNNYALYGGIVAGFHNSIFGEYASITGGGFNTASGVLASVSGGGNNAASGDNFASISGGDHNTASGNDASVSGGYNNTASWYASSVSGGANRIVAGNYNWAAGSSGKFYSGRFFANS